jgi:hypothetical protein
MPGFERVRAETVDRSAVSTRPGDALPPAKLER